jgi:hypothetical protein
MQATKEARMPEPDDDATLSDEEIETRPVGTTASNVADDSDDTGDDTGDVSDTTDTGDDTGDVSDTTDTGDDSGDDSGDDAA